MTRMTYGMQMMPLKICRPIYSRIRQAFAVLGAIEVCLAFGASKSELRHTAMPNDFGAAKSGVVSCAALQRLAFNAQFSLVPQSLAFSLCRPERCQL